MKLIARLTCECSKTIREQRKMHRKASAQWLLCRRESDDYFPNYYLTFFCNWFKNYIWGWEVLLCYTGSNHIGSSDLSPDLVSYLAYNIMKKQKAIPKLPEGNLHLHSSYKNRNHQWKWVCPASHSYTLASCLLKLGHRLAGANLPCGEKGCYII